MSATTKTTRPVQELFAAEALLAILETAICDTEVESAPDPAHVRVLLGQVRGGRCWMRPSRCCLPAGRLAQRNRTNAKP